MFTSKTNLFIKVTQILPETIVESLSQAELKKYMPSDTTLLILKIPMFVVFKFHAVYLLLKLVPKTMCRETLPRGKVFYLAVYITLTNGLLLLQKPGKTRRQLILSNYKKCMKVTCLLSQ